MSDEDFRDHYRLCKAVFQKWINEHREVINDLSQARTDLQRKLCDLCDEKILWDREGREWKIEGTALRAECESLQARVNSTEKERDALHRESMLREARFDNVVRSLKASEEACQELQAQRTIQPPPDLPTDLVSQSYAVLQRLLDEQNSYVKDTKDKVARSAPLQQNLDKGHGNALRLRQAIAFKDDREQQARKPKSVEDALCICCAELPKTFALYPCGHRHFCGECADKIVNPGTLRPTCCPFCRKEVVACLRVFC